MLIKLVKTEEIVENNAEVIRRLSLLVLRIHKLVGKLVILNDGRMLVLEANNSDSLIREHSF